MGELDDLKKLSPKERAKKLKEIIEKKKKEINEIEDLYKKSMSELSDRIEEPENNIQENNQPKTIEDTISEEIPKKEEEPLENIASLYQRIKSYNELLQEGEMDYNLFNAAMNVYQQIREESSKIGSIDNIYISKKAEEITNIAKRMISEISGSYLKDVMDYRGPETR